MLDMGLTKSLSNQKQTKYETKKCSIDIIVVNKIIKQRKCLQQNRLFSKTFFNLLILRFSFYITVLTKLYCCSYV